MADIAATRALVAAPRDAALDPARALAFVAHAEFGGQALFVGRVRRHNHGRDVVAVEYDLFEPLVRRTFDAIAREAMADITPELRIYVAHAHGRLEVGDIAVVVAAGSRHRDEAFRACRAVIEGVKHRAPIWKRERFVDGSSEWSEGCSLCGDRADGKSGTGSTP
jgi:molybdopterin synthase catalytic subunit